MPRVNRLSCLLLPAALLVSGCGGGASDLPPPRTVAQVDLDRYLGRWYEIAKIPNRFQTQCIADTTATYARLPDGRIQVINRCLTAGDQWDQAEGIARVVDPVSNAKLEVSFVSLFGHQLFWGDYWILELAEDYSYVIVGHPQRRFGWILARTPQLDIELDGRLRELGYAPDDFEPSTQRDRAASPMPE